MTSWIYVLSKFTPEALLLEALMICVLMAGYASFWILRKRKLGATDALVPASVVKAYLGELIGEATDLRSQLFGLLGGGEATAAAHASGGAARTLISALTPEGATAGTPADSAKVAAVESKLAEQERAMEKILGEKATLEKDLAEARAKATSAPAADGAAAAAGGASAADLKKLQDKIQMLEARLAEYSVIEDDLANLKRLQQENARLKAQLGGGAAAEAEAATSAEPAAAAAPAETQPSQPAPATTADPSFEGLVDQVEKSLQQSPAPAPTAAAATEPAPSQPAPAAPKAPGAEKSDEDLIAEFEKMLNS